MIGCLSRAELIVVVDFKFMLIYIFQVFLLLASLA